MKYLVTGGAGFIGSNTVDRLIDLGHSVTVIDNESAESHETFYWNNKANNYKIDINSYEDIRPLFNGIDYVIHLAAESRIQPTINNPILAVQTNAVGTANVLQASKEAGVKRLVYSSTSSAYGKNEVPNVETQPSYCNTPYSVAKVAGEELCRLYYNIYGLETVILRYFNVYGNREPVSGQYAPVIGLFKRQKNNGQPMTIVGTGDQRRDFTNVSDVVEANILSCNTYLDHDVIGTIFNIGTGKNYSINEIVSMIGGDSVHIPKRVGESFATLADNTKAMHHLGWKPSINLETFLQNYI